MSSTPNRKAPGCAICGKPMDAAYRPFCSRRCADEDLRRWLTGAYVVPGRETDEEGQQGPQPSADED